MVLMSSPPAEILATAVPYGFLGSGLAGVLSGIGSLPLGCWQLMDEALLEQLVKALQPCFPAVRPSLGLAATVGGRACWWLAGAAGIWCTACGGRGVCDSLAGPPRRV